MSNHSGWNKAYSKMNIRNKSNGQNYWNKVVKNLLLLAQLFLLFPLTEEESAEGSLLQQPVGWSQEDSGYSVGRTWSHMAW